MFTSGSKYYFGASAFAFVAAVVYGAFSGVHHGVMDPLLGPLTLGWKGSIGDPVGYSILIGASGIALFLGSVVVAFRDGDATAAAQLVSADQVPDVDAPESPSYAPIFGAFGAALLLIGLVVGEVLFLFGVVVVSLVVIEWAAKVWSDRATGDPEVNRRIRNRIMYPIEVPVIGILVVGGFVLSVSRILLALPEVGADVLFGAIPVLIFIVAIAFASRDRISKNVVVGVMLLGALCLFVGAIIGLAAGEQKPKEEKAKAEEVVPVSAGAGNVWVGP